MENHLSDFTSVQYDQHQNIEEVLFDAVKNNDLNVIKKCINNGFNKDQYIRNGWTLFMHACSQGKPDVIEYLLNAGEDPNVCFQKFTPLMAVCFSANFDEDELLRCVDLLIKYDVDVNSRDRYGQTALMFAVKQGHRKIINKLISCKCNNNIQDCEGKSALFYAVLKRKEDIVKQLVESGIKLDLIDSEGRTAYDVASFKGFHEISKLVMTSEDDQVELDKILLEEESIYKQEPIDSLLNQLPSRNGNLDYSGFPSDVELLLSGMEMLKFKDCFIKHNIQLGEFLTITDQRLREIGITFSVHRQHILYCIQKFHFRPWNKLSLGYKATNLPVNLEDAILLMANSVKHLHILKATTQYLRSEIQKPIDMNIYENVERLSKELKIIDWELNKINKFASNLDRRERLQPSDMIRPKSAGKKTAQKITILLLSVLMFGGLLWKNHKYFGLVNQKISSLSIFLL